MKVRSNGGGSVWIKPILDGDGEITITVAELHELEMAAKFVIDESQAES